MIPINITDFDKFVHRLVMIKTLVGALELRQNIYSARLDQQIYYTMCIEELCHLLELMSSTETTVTNDFKKCIC